MTTRSGRRRSSRGGTGGSVTSRYARGPTPTPLRRARSAGRPWPDRRTGGPAHGTAGGAGKADGKRSGGDGSDRAVDASTLRHPASTTSTMALPTYETIGQRPCAWCATPLPILDRPGRPRIYCKPSCRQRANERRSGLGVLPPVDRKFTAPNPILADVPRAIPAYEAGVTAGGRRVHALRPAARSDRRGRRLTLCGILARPNGRPFGPVHPVACLTCSAVRRIRPPGQPILPSQELATIRAILEDAGVWLDRRRRTGSLPASVARPDRPADAPSDAQRLPAPRRSEFGVASGRPTVRERRAEGALAATFGDVRTPVELLAALVSAA